jgi:hypothetical protein
MADREWFKVEMSSGGTIGPDYSTKDLAVAAAREVSNQHDALVVVKYIRKEVRTFTRSITVAEADLPT